MSKPQKSEPDFELDLKALGFDGDGETPEPDTSVTIATIVEDQKTPGNLKSFLAILSYQRGTRKELHAFKHWIGLRLAYVVGFVAALLLGLEVYRSLKGGH